MDPAPVNFVARRGATWIVSLLIEDDAVPLDLTPYSAVLNARLNPNAAGWDFSLTDGAGITLGGPAGTLVLEMSASETLALEPGRYYYRLDLLNGVAVEPLFYGDFRILQEV